MWFRAQVARRTSTRGVCRLAAYLGGALLGVSTLGAQPAGPQKPPTKTAPATSRDTVRVPNGSTRRPTGSPQDSSRKSEPSQDSAMKAAVREGAKEGAKEAVKEMLLKQASDSAHASARPAPAKHFDGDSARTSGAPDAAGKPGRQTDTTQRAPGDSATAQAKSKARRKSTGRKLGEAVKTVVRVLVP